MRGVAWTEILSTLSECEEIPADACGLISFGTPPGGGGIFVEKGRICWAAASGLRRRLSDLLREQATLRDVDMEALYARCRAEGKPLGLLLLEEKLIALPDLEAALRRHSAESLVELCHAGLPTRWVQRSSGRGYEPRLTYRPIEVLFDIVRLFDGPTQEAAAAELGALAGPEGRGAAFLLDEESETLVPIAELGAMTVRSARALGRWATSITAATRELGAAQAFTLASTGDGFAVSVSWRGRVIFALVCEDRSTVAAVTARHMACV
jgi:hypothetical protein